MKLAAQKPAGKQDFSIFSVHNDDSAGSSGVGWAQNILFNG
jgi:hypothetical protein